MNLSQIFSIAFKAWAQRDAISALAVRYRPFLALLQADPKLGSDTIALVTAITGSVAPANYGSVSWIQSSLNTVVGSGIMVDGELGPETEKAIKAFQAKFGLTVDGLAGIDTCSVLDAKVNAAS